MATVSPFSIGGITEELTPQGHVIPYYADIEAMEEISDPLGLSSFLPPAGWIEWDFFGYPAFSPSEERVDYITYRLIEEEHDFTGGNTGVIIDGSKGDNGEVKEDNHWIVVDVEGVEEINTEEEYLKGVIKDYEDTFSTPNYISTMIEPRELDGYPGVEVLALGTEKNELFGGYYIWIVEFYTPTHTINLTFECREGNFEALKGVVERSLHTLTLK